MGIFDAIGGVVGGMLGAKSTRRQSNRDYVRQREFAQNAIQWRTEDAQAAGIHPLFAMGAQAGNFMPSSGSGASDSYRQIGRSLGHGAQTLRDDFLQAQIENTEAKTQAIKLNAKQDNIKLVPGIHPQAEEIEKGRIQPFYQRNPEQNLSIKSPMTRVRIGSQKVWVPVEEMDEFMENPLAVGALTFAYKGNDNINWSKLANDYVGTKKSSPWKRKLIAKIAAAKSKLRRKRKPKGYYSPSIPKPRR